MMIDHKIKMMLNEATDKKKLSKLIKQYEALIHKIENEVKNKSTYVIAIDGHSTAGKTTLGIFLSRLFDANLFHMDDFYRSQSQTKSVVEYASNIDLDRLQFEVILSIQEQRDIEYKKFNCKTQSFSTPIECAYKKINIIEGAYSMHPQIASIYDLKIFLTASYFEQIVRIIRRNGIKSIKMFIQKWIPYERKYFKNLQIKKKSDEVIHPLH